MLKSHHIIVSFIILFIYHFSFFVLLRIQNKKINGTEKVLISLHALLVTKNYKLLKTRVEKCFKKTLHE